MRGGPHPAAHAIVPALDDARYPVEAKARAHLQAALNGDRDHPASPARDRSAGNPRRRRAIRAHAPLRPGRSADARNQGEAGVAELVRLLERLSIGIEAGLLTIDECPGIRRGIVCATLRAGDGRAARRGSRRSDGSRRRDGSRRDPGGDSPAAGPSWRRDRFIDPERILRILAALSVEGIDHLDRICGICAEIVGGVPATRLRCSNTAGEIEALRRRSRDGRHRRVTHPFRDVSGPF
jgi:hypothetical protein